MWLEIRSGEDAGRVVEVDRPHVLGRVHGVDLVIRDARASRRHAEIEPVEGGLRLRDLDSANGTLVDGQAAQDVVLCGGEEIRIGDVRIGVLAHGPRAAGAATAGAVRARTGPAPTWSAIGRVVDAKTRHGRRIGYVALGLACAVVAVGAVLALTGTSEADRVAAAVRDVSRATVPIQVSRATGGGATGSGWVLDAGAGLVVTAGHVVNEGDTFSVDGTAAELLAAAPCEDLALLRIRGGTRAPALEFAGAAGWRQGESVLALGFAEAPAAGEPPSSTRGVIAAARTSYRDPAPDVPSYPAAIRTDTALDPGFSGGPLVNLDGRVVGVNAAARTAGGDGRPLQGANYAIAGDRARRVLQGLRGGRSEAWIGASFGYPDLEELAARRLPPGLWLQGAVPGSGAAAAGLGGAGELLAAVDGHPLDATLSGWCSATAGIASGATAELTVIGAGGRRRLVDVRFD